MKLATLKNDTRDGALVVVSRDLSHCVDASAIAPTLQAALDNWETAKPELELYSQQLDAGELATALPFVEAACASPLPRAYQWADGSAYVNHVELVRKARNAEIPDSFWSDPLMYQGGSDIMLGARDDIEVIDEEWGIDLEAEIAVITDDVPMGIVPDGADGHIKLVLLANDVSLRNLIPTELGKGFGFFQSKPATSFSPVVVTPDSLGDAWDGRKMHGTVDVAVNGQRLGNLEAGADMYFDFAQLISHAARTRHLGAGTIVGSGTVSNRDRSRGSGCLAEVRTIETIETGTPKTPFMKFGDRVTIDMRDAAGASIFGGIDQKIVRYTPR